MRVAALFRVSTEQQENEGASLPSQERTYTALEKARGWKTVARFRGQESAAGAGSERVVLQELLACIREQRVDAVWVIEQSRLTRGDQLEVALLLREMVERKVGLFVGGAELRDLSSIDGEMMYSVQAAFDRAEHRRIRERMMRGRREKARAGRRVGGRAPYGYRNPPHGDAGRGFLRPHELEADVVRRIFRDVAGGVGLKELARKLTAEGVPAPRGGSWAHSTIARMLGNPVYLGTQVCGAWRAPEGLKNYRLDLTHPEAIVVDGAHPALVSRELFDSARSQLGGTSNGRPGLLTGLLWINGRRVQVDGDRQRPFYVAADGAPGPWVPTEPVQDIVWRAFVSLFRSPAWLARIFHAGGRHELEQALAAELEQLERRKAKLAARLERLVEMRSDGEISRQVFAEKSHATERSVRELEEAIRGARRRREAANAGQLERGLAAVRALVGRRIDTAGRRTLLRHVLESVHATVVESGARQPRAAGGAFAPPTAPKWKVEDVFFRLRPHPGADTSRCSSVRPAPARRCLRAPCPASCRRSTASRRWR
jgi:site-specific DNA recombinase